MTTNVRIDPPTKYRSPWIEGYASKTSVRPGETITISRQHESRRLPSCSRSTASVIYQGHGGRS